VVTILKHVSATINPSFDRARWAMKGMRIAMACYVLTAAFHATSKSSMFERQNPLKGSIQGGNELDNVLVSSIHVLLGHNLFVCLMCFMMNGLYCDRWMMTMTLAKG